MTQAEADALHAKLAAAGQVTGQPHRPKETPPAPVKLSRFAKLMEEQG